MFNNKKMKKVDKIKRFLTEGEYIEEAYKTVIDIVCFTNKRIIFFDNKLVSKKKKRVSVPYKSITSYAIEEAGMFDIDAELILFTRGGEFEIDFARGTNMIEVDKMIAKHIGM